MKKSTADMKSRSIAAMAWSAADIAGRQGIQFVVALILARLLSPAEFGLIGMLSLFVAVAGTFVDSGFVSALIQRKEITETDKSSVFVFNVVAGAIVALALSVAAPWIARFYAQPILVPLTQFMALNLFIGSFGAVQVALLSRELDFRAPFKAGVVAGIASGIVAIWMAWKGYGVWSLAAQSLISTIIYTLLIWVLHPWRPMLQFRTASLRPLFGFGSRLLASGLLNTFFERIQFTVIGKAFSAVDLGYYARAQNTQQLPAGLLSVVVTRVTFPIFSQLAGDRSALRRGVQRALVGIMIPTMPMMIGLAAVARPLVLVLFGEKWLPCVPYLQILSISGVFWPLHIINLNILTAIGRSDLFFRLEVIKKVMTCLGLLLTFRISVMAMVWAVLIVSVLCVFVNSHYSRDLIKYGLLAQLHDIAPYAGISVSMGVVAWAVSTFCGSQPAAQLLFGVLCGATFYCTSCYVSQLKDYRSVFDSIVALRHGAEGQQRIASSDGRYK